MKLKAPHILDVTLRDGSYLANHRISPDFSAKLAQGLSQAGIQYAEICHGAGIGSGMMGYESLVDDDELMEAAKRAAPELKLSAFIPPSEKCIPIIPGLVDFFEIGRVGVNVDAVTTVEKIAKKLKKFDKIISLQLVRTHARSPEFAAEAAKIAEDLGASIVYVVDSFGSMQPNEVTQYVAAIQAKTRVEVGFHGHNHTGLAVPNAIAAWEAGASWIDASLMGVGRAPGNTLLEALVLLLQNQDFRQDLNLKKLCQTTQEVVLPFFEGAPQISLKNLICAREKLDFISEEILQILADMTQQSFSEFMQRLRQNIGDKVQLEESDLRNFLKIYDLNYDKIMTSMGSSK